MNIKKIQDYVANIGNFFKSILSFSSRIKKLEERVSLLENATDKPFLCRSCRKGVYLFQKEITKTGYVYGCPLSSKKIIYKCSNPDCQAEPPSSWKEP